MKTCAYCGSSIQNKYCNYCEMELTDKYILENGNRLNNTIAYFPDLSGIFKNTKELLKLETIELLCLLQHARQYRSDVYNLRINVHKAREQGANMDDFDVTSFNDYEDATRKVWVIENIIKDRIGYYPKKVTVNFLSIYLERIEKSQRKKMIMRKTIGKYQKQQ